MACAVELSCLFFFVLFTRKSSRDAFPRALHDDSGRDLIQCVLFSSACALHSTFKVDWNSNLWSSWIKDTDSTDVMWCGLCHRFLSKLNLNWTGDVSIILWLLEMIVFNIVAKSFRWFLLSLLFCWYSSPCWVIYIFFFFVCRIAIE